MSALVEGFDSDARALALFLAREGSSVRIASRSHDLGAVSRLRDLGVAVEPGADLDHDPGPADVAYLDVWTPEIAPRVQRLRAQGTRVSCIGDLLLERWPGPTIGITGTAGKTTATSLVASILRAGGINAAASVGARAGNLWPTGELLDSLESSEAPTQVLVLELTSSHLAFMSCSPTIGAIISFWPDHLELHGSLARYRAAKQTIMRHQTCNDIAVVNADDASAEFAVDARGRVLEFSLSRPVRHGAYLESDATAVLVDPLAGETRLGRLDTSVTHPCNAVAAAAIALAAGASSDAIWAGIEADAPLQHRARPVGTLRGVAVIDDGMAATPAKTAALLRRYEERSIILVAGGLDDAGGGPVHATPEEAAMLESACDEISRVAVRVVVFGPGGEKLRPLLARRRMEVEAAPTLESALSAAAERTAGATRVVFSPMFPVSAQERPGFEALVRRGA